MSRPRPRPSDTELADHYVHRRHTQARITTERGVHPVTVSAWLRNDGIPTRRDGRGGFSAERQAALRANLPAGYTKGASIRALAAEHGISPKTVHTYLRAAGVTLRSAGGSHPRLSVERREQVVAAYEEGTSIRALAAEHGISPGTVRRYLMAAGVTLRGPGGPRTPKAEGPR